MLTDDAIMAALGTGLEAGVWEFAPALEFEGSKVEIHRVCQGTRYFVTIPRDTVTRDFEKFLRELNPGSRITGLDTTYPLYRHGRNEVPKKNVAFIVWDDEAF